MAAGVGSVIEKADYDTIKSKVDLIFGTGSGQSGYGQTITSPAVAIGGVIYASDWVSLRNDMVKARQHQTGATIGSTSALDSANLLLPASGSAITEALRNQFNTFANTITTDKFLVAGSQLSAEGLITGTRTTAWNGTITHTVTLSSSADNMRYFFNAGGKVRISANRSGGSSSSKNTTWDLMFSQMGELVMDYTQTTFTGSSATGTAIGWFDLTISNQTIASKAAPAGAYSSNLYTISARRDAASTQLILTIQFQDNAGPNPNFDEDVDGTLNSVIALYRPSGANVSVTAPSASQVGP